MSKPCKHNANFGSQGKDPVCDYCGERVDVRVMSIGDYETLGRLKAKLEKAEAALEKLKQGPGIDMAGWKLTWAHDYADKALKEIRK